MASSCLQLSPIKKSLTLLKNLSFVATIAVAFCLETGLATSTYAATINGTISGTVTSVIGSEQGVMLGSPVSGTYSYDNATTISETYIYPYNDGSQDQFTYVGYPLQAFELSIGDSPITFNLSDLEGAFLSQPAVIFGGIEPTSSGAQELDFFISSSAFESFLSRPGYSGSGASVTYGGANADPYPQSIGIFDEGTSSFRFTFSATSTPVAVPEPDVVAGISVFGLFCLLRRKVVTSRRS